MRAAEIRDLSVEDLKSKLTETQKVYQDLRSTHVISPLENPLEIKSVRRDIARIKTELNKRNA